VVICQALFENFTDYLEGDLTKIKSKLVSRETCAQISGQLGLQKFLKVGKGMVSNRALSGSLAAGVLETVIAAIYLDGGFDAAREFILRIFGSLIEQATFSSKAVSSQQYRCNAYNCCVAVVRKPPLLKPVLLCRCCDLLWTYYSIVDADIVNQTGKECAVSVVLPNTDIKAIAENSLAILGIFGYFNAVNK